MYFYRAWLIAFEVGKITLTPVVASHLKSSLLVSVVWEITIWGKTESSMKNGGHWESHASLSCQCADYQPLDLPPNQEYIRTGGWSESVWLRKIWNWSEFTTVLKIVTRTVHLCVDIRLLLLSMWPVFYFWHSSIISTGLWDYSLPTKISARGSPDTGIQASWHNGARRTVNLKWVIRNHFSQSNTAVYNGDTYHKLYIPQVAHNTCCYTAQ